MDRDTILSLLMVNTLELWSRSLDGGCSAATEALNLVLNNPRPGDCVLEISTRRNDPSRFGKLLRVVDEPLDGECWYIQDIDDNEQRWYNCQFIRVLEHDIDPIEEAKARNLVTPNLVRRLQEIEEQVANYVRMREGK